MAVKKISLSDVNNPLSQDAGGLQVGAEKVTDLDESVPAVGEMPRATDVGGHRMEPSGILSGDTAEIGSILRMAPFVDADCAAPGNGDCWFYITGGLLKFKYRYGGITFEVELTEPA